VGWRAGVYSILGERIQAASPGMEELMKVMVFLLVSMCALLMISCVPSEPVAPVAEQRPHELEMHGEVRVDDYYWLRERANPEVLAYLEAENAYTKAVMATTEALQEELYTELKNRIPSTPSTAGARARWRRPRRSPSMSTRWPRVTTSARCGPAR
jgi:hypothetical protein